MCALTTRTQRLYTGFAKTSCTRLAVTCPKISVPIFTIVLLFEGNNVVCFAIIANVFLFSRASRHTCVAKRCVDLSK